MSVFEESAQLSLEVEYDPESLDVMLFLMVRQEHYSEDLDEILDKIKSIRKMYRSAGFVDTSDFLVMTDGQPPLEL
jgi:hypothetical protein